MKLSIVDLGAVQPGEDPAQALQHSVELAVEAESLGYERIWYSEHHGKAVVNRSPDVMVASAAALTSKIRIGSGSVLLNHYSSYRVAETFCTLNELYPGRIDLVIGRATAGPVIDLALQQDRSKPFHPNSDAQLDELIAWLQDSFTPDNVFATIPIHTIESRPELHVSGSSSWSARAAASRGLRYVFASFFNPFQTRESLELYRENFRPSEGSAGVKAPEVRVGLHIVCADTEVEARRQIGPVQMMYRYLSEGKLQFVLPSPEESVRLLGGLPAVDPYVPSSCVPPRFMAGTIDQIAEQLRHIQIDLGVTEFVIQDVTTDHEARIRSYELLADLLD